MVFIHHVKNHKNVYSSETTIFYYSLVKLYKKCIKYEMYHIIVIILISAVATHGHVFKFKINS